MPRLSVTSGRPITNGSQDPHLGMAHLSRGITSIAKKSRTLETLFHSKKFWIIMQGIR